MSGLEPPADPPEGREPSVAAAVFRVSGVVQGVGFRPFVYALARRCGLRGWVRNTSAGVEIAVEGAAADVESFAAALPDEAPERAFIASLERAPAEPTGAAKFVILESAADPTAYQLVSPDIALCDDCRRELLDPSDRRYRYPFINCTNCGPRFTIIESLPYDRERTTMRGFTLCDDCRREYRDPSDRRFHAEPIACPVCGPHVELWRRGAWEPDSSGAVAPQAQLVAERDEAIRLAGGVLREGAIVAVKGLGGFHLACDATNGDVVRELKRRKGRPDKPLAVMMTDLEEIHRHCTTDAIEEELLASPEQPIVLVRWPAGEAAARAKLGNGEESAGAAAARAGLGRRDGSASGMRPCGDEGGIDPEVAVRQRYLGVMLPYTPLHVLLLREAGRPLVMTSGNLAEEPIVATWDELARLGGIPDYYLVHDRDIYARYDDSVALVRAGRPRLVRRSRGYAPFPVALPRALPKVLACGAELKNSFCLTRDANAFVSQHIGDLENLETLEHFEVAVELYKSLFRLEPELVAYDLHPEYLATKYALGLPGPKLGVQHHHAHVAACLVEHRRAERVIGVSMDGLGFGTDGRLWGGEIMACDLSGFRRLAHLEELPLPGGALAIRRPARTAAGWVAALLGPDAARRAAARVGWAGEATHRRDGADGGRGLLGEDELEAVLRQVETGVNAPSTTSCGRLFDAVAALAGVRGEITYEGQAAIELEMASSPGAEPYPYVVDERDARPGDVWGSMAGGAGGAGRGSSLRGADEAGQTSLGEGGGGERPVSGSSGWPLSSKRCWASSPVGASRPRREPARACTPPSRR